MREWRRTLKSWPMETPRMAESGSLPSWLDPKARLRDVRGEMLVALGMILAAFGFPMGAALVAMHFLTPDGTGGLAFALGAIGFAVAAATMVFAASRGEEWSGRRRARRALDRLEARGEATLDGEAVGVTYAEERWRMDLLGDAWDWGALRFDFDRLSFVGEHSRFDLRSSDLVGTEVRCYNPGLGGPQPRLYLRYVREGKIESIGIDLPYAHSVRSRVEGIGELQAKVERWCGEPILPIGTVLTRLPRIEDAPKPTVSRYQRIGRPAKILATVATAAIAVVVEIVVILILIALGWEKVNSYLAGFKIIYFVLWLLLAAKIEAKLPERYRYRANEEFDVRNALRDVEPTIRADPLIDAKFEQ